MSDAKLDRVCIIMMSAVGDVVHVLPVINAIKRRHPASHITWILQPGPAELVRGHPQVDEILTFDRKAGLKSFGEIREQLKSRSFDLALNLQVYLKAGIITSFVKAPVKLGFDKARARDANWLFTNRKIEPHPEGQHVQDQYFEFLDELGIPYEPVEWGLGPWEHERAWQRDFFSKLDRPAATIVVATSKVEKDWMPERWAEVVDRLYEEYGLRSILAGSGSPREMAAEQVIMKRTKHTPLSAQGSGLRKLVSILDGSALVISPDTGPLHMSVALNRPVITLIGYSNPRRVGPYRRFHDLMIDAYGDPGEKYPVSMENRPGRMPRISVDDVMAKVKVWKERYSSDAG